MESDDRYHMYLGVASDGMSKSHDGLDSLALLVRSVEDVGASDGVVIWGGDVTQAT